MTVMDSSYSFLSTRSMDFSDFDCATLTPVDNPIFYKAGESSHLPETNAVFHPLADDPLKRWKSGLPQENAFSSPSSPPAPFLDMVHGKFEEWMQFDEDTDMALDTASYDERFVVHPSRQHSHVAQWQTWDSMERLASIPISAARSSIMIEPTSPKEDSAGVYWSQGVEQDGLYGAESPLSPFEAWDYYAGRNSYCLPQYSQPQNTPNDPTQSIASLSSAFQASSFRQMLYPSIATVSPPASSVSSSSSSPSPSSPEFAVHTQIPLHQPRPSRRIPIVSLSELASACEPDMSISPSNQSSSRKYSEAQRGFPAGAPPVFFSLDSSRADGSIDELQFANGDVFENYSAKAPLPSTYYVTRGSEAVCSCGCMESYR